MVLKQAEGGDKEMMLDDLYTKKDIIERYKIAAGTLSQWIFKKFIPYTKIGKNVYFPMHEIEKWEKQAFRPPRVTESNRNSP